MRLRSLLWLFFGAIAGWGVLQAQKPFKDYPGVEYENFPLPPDWQQPAEWTRARLRYPSFFSRPRHSATATTAGPSIIPVRTATCSRESAGLTRIDTRSVEQSRRSRWR